MGLAPTAVCDALSCHVSLMWLINLPSSVSSVGRPVPWKCDLLLHTHRRRDGCNEWSGSDLRPPSLSFFSIFVPSMMYFSSPRDCLKLSTSLASQPRRQWHWAGLLCSVFLTRFAFLVNRDLYFHSSGRLCCFVSPSYWSARISICRSQWKMRSKVNKGKGQGRSLCWGLQVSLLPCKFHWCLQFIFILNIQRMSLQYQT